MRDFISWPYRPALTKTERCIQNYCFDYLCQCDEMWTTLTKPACGTLDRSVHKITHRRLCCTGLGWQGHKQKFTSKMTPKLQCTSTSLSTHPLPHSLLCFPTTKDLCQSTNRATWHRHGKKQFALYQITNTPGPVLRPALRRYENRAHGVEKCQLQLCL